MRVGIFYLFAGSTTVTNGRPTASGGELGPRGLNSNIDLHAVPVSCHSEACNDEESPTMNHPLNLQGTLRYAQSDRLRGVSNRQQQD